MTVPVPVSITDSDAVAMIGEYVPTKPAPVPISKDVEPHLADHDDHSVLDEYDHAIEKATSGALGLVPSNLGTSWANVDWKRNPQRSRTSQDFKGFFM